MKKYEVLYILANNLDEAAKEAQIAKYEAIVTNAGGEVTTTKWGVKKLAYPINFKNEGYYVLMSFTSDPSLPKELDRVLTEFTANADLPLEIERQMRIAKDEVLRFMIVAKD